MLIFDPLNAASYATPALEAAEAVIDTALTAAPASLAFAQAQKASLVEAIFNTLRQAPIAYTVGSTAYTWDARDEAVAALNSALVAALIAGGNAAISAVSNLNAQLQTLAEGGTPSVVSVPAAAIGTVQWTPIGATAPVTLQPSDAADLIAAIAARRATLQSVRLTLQASIAACTTVAQVVALSVSGAAW